jgi:hypothetical protein
MKKLLSLLLVFFTLIILQACATHEHETETPINQEPIVQDPVVEEPTVEDPVIEEPAELNTILSYNFGTSVNFGYAQGNLE